MSFPISENILYFSTNGIYSTTLNKITELHLLLVNHFRLDIILSLETLIECLKTRELRTYHSRLKSLSMVLLRNIVERKECNQRSSFKRYLNCNNEINDLLASNL